MGPQPHTFRTWFPVRGCSVETSQGGTALQPRSEPIAFSTSAAKWSCTLFPVRGCKTEPHCNTTASRLHSQPPRQNGLAHCFLQEVAGQNRTATPQRADCIFNLCGKMVLHTVSGERLQDGTALQPRSETIAFSTSAAKWSCTLFPVRGCKTEPHCNTAANRLHFQPPRQNGPARCFLQEVARQNRAATPQRAVCIFNLRGKMVLHTVSGDRLQDGTALQHRSEPIAFSTSAGKSTGRTVQLLKSFVVAIFSLNSQLNSAERQSIFNKNLF